MKDYRGIIFAYSACPALRELSRVRTAASLPFCSRYRLIDFSLSSLRNAGVLDVGIIMQRDYQSLLDHIGSGKAWDMSRRNGGIRLLPPFGLSEYNTGNYTGTIEALNAVSAYVKGISEKYVIILLGNMCANIDLSAVMDQHRNSEAEITSICSESPADGTYVYYSVGADGFVREMLFDPTGNCGGLSSLEGYIINRDTLIKMMDRCKVSNLFSFHRHALSAFLSEGGLMGVYVHKEYAALIRTVDSYYKASMDMLSSDAREKLFPASRPVRTKNREGVSAYYGEHASARNCLVADNCIIDGELENCIVFSGVRIAQGVKAKNSIIFSQSTLGDMSELDYVIADKYCVFPPHTKLIGSPSLPMVIPKGTSI